MRGIDQQKNYNSFIRVRKHARQHNSLTIKEEEENHKLIKGKENSQSTHTQTHADLTAPNKAYFHEAEEKLEKMVYCNYNWSAIGSIDASTPGRDQHILKRLPNVFKKVRPNHQSTKLFLLRKKKTE
jgi:hypothetical protein